MESLASVEPQAALRAVDPATGEVLREVARSGPTEIEQAVANAHEALASNDRWRIPVVRAAALQRLAAALHEQRERLATLECLDTGKPLSQAHADVEAAERYFSYYGGAADKILGSQIPLGPDFVDYTVREPWGVCAQIIPWNYPLQIAARCVAPALAAGNPVVLKPSEEAFLTPLELGALAAESGVPPGVLHVLPGDGDVGAALVDHPLVRHVTFVGSPSTGARVAQAAAARLVPVNLELGGKSPNVVFADADLSRAVPAIVRALIQNAGQSCSAGTRLLVERAAWDELLNRVCDALSRLTLGRGLDDPDIGPLISERQFHSPCDTVGVDEYLAGL
jgi:aldehyde dehydrogenase (NAD+)/betaine-aldehyde dehydrogenase